MAFRQKYKKAFSAFVVISTIASTVLIASFEPSTAQRYQSDIPSETKPENSFLVKVSLGNALSAGRIAGKAFADKQAIKAFYDARENSPYWISNDGPYSRAERLLAKLEESWTHGLNPANYHTAAIAELIARPNMLNKAELELLLTDAFVRYARDMSGMRINPEDMKLDAKDWLMPLEASDVLTALIENDSFDRIMNSLEPKGATYQKLRKEYMSLLNEPAPDYEKYLPVEFGGIMKPGWGHKGVLKLRQRLGVAVPEHQPYKYDDELAAAVMKFQRENGLEPDGIIGSRTLQLLNRTKHEKLLQLIANMERLRWVPEEKPDKFIVVNIPSATLWGIEQGRVKLEMPVIVGSPWRRTRSFKTEVTGVRLNPDWTVPPTIKAFDIVPKVQEDPYYLTDKGIEVLRGYGSEQETLDPMSIDWNNISKAELSKLRFVQTPGEHNPLGRIRILMPNPYNMYLHDTNHPELFDKPERQLSSGCMRMKYPEKVADFVMKGTSGWSKRAMDEILETGETTDIDAARKIPVYVMYYTAWIGEKGNIVFGPDVYNYDSKLVELLDNIDGLPFSRHYDADSALGAPGSEIASAR